MSTIIKLQGLVTFVTGAASGLGRATVERFLRQGVKGCIAFDRQPFKHNDKTQDASSQLVLATGDVTSELDVKSALEQCHKTFGRLDVVVNCAGVLIAERTFNRDKDEVHDLNAFKNVVNINTIGTFNVNRLCAGLIAKNEKQNGLRGVLINTASISAFEGQVGQVAYAASNGGIVGMTLPMARDLAVEGIRVVTIAPGLFDTPLFDNIIPKRITEQLAEEVLCPNRLGHMDEFAHLVQGIVENPMLNGEVIRIDGGIRFQP